MLVVVEKYNMGMDKKLFSEEGDRHEGGYFFLRVDHVLLFINT